MILGPKHLKGRIPLAFCNSGYPTLFVAQSAFRDAFWRVPWSRHGGSNSLQWVLQRCCCIRMKKISRKELFNATHQSKFTAIVNCKYSSFYLCLHLQLFAEKNFFGLQENKETYLVRG